MSRSFVPAGLIWLGLAIASACIPERGQAQTPPAKPQLSAEERAAKVVERDRLWKEAGELRAAGKFDEALERLARHIPVQRALFGDRTVGEAEALEQIALNERDRHHWAEARAAAADALAIQEKVHGSANWHTVDARLLVADVDTWSRLEPAQRQQLDKAADKLAQARKLAVAGKHQEAIPLAQVAWATRRAILGDGHRLTADALAREGFLYNAIGDYAKATSPNERALKIREQALGNRHPDYAQSLNNLAFDYERAGSLVKAAEQYRQAGEICERAVGKAGDPVRIYQKNLVNVLEKLAAEHQQHERFAEARKCREEILAVVREVWGAEHWKVVDAKLALADVERWSKLTGDQRAQLAKAGQLLADVSRLRDQGKLREAVPLAEQTLALRRQVLGDDHRLSGDAWNQLGFLYSELRDAKNAEAAYRRAVEIGKKALGEVHPDYAQSLNNLASQLKRMRNYARVEPQLSAEERAATLAERARLWNEAGELRAAGKLDEALERLAIEIKLDRALFGDKTIDEAQTLEQIALNERDRHHWSEARAAAADALAIQEKVHGSANWHTVDARLLVADVERWSKLTGDQRAQLAEADRRFADANQLLGQGRYRQAVPLTEQTLALRRQVLGDDHRLSGDAWNQLGFLYNELRDAKNAEAAHRKALEIYKKSLGEAHPNYALSLNNLAAVYHYSGDNRRAEPLYIQALEIDKQALGEAHPDYASDLNNLASLYDAMGAYARAEPLYKQALEIRKQALGEAHPAYAESLHNLALLYDNLGDYARAEPLYKQALEIKRKARGEAHPDYATSLNNLAVLYRNMGDYARAEPLYNQALEIRKQALGEAHPDYALSLNNLAGLYNNMGDYARAEPLYEQALEICKKALGEAHPDYAGSLNNLGMLQLALGRPADAERLLRQAVQIERKSLDLTAVVQSEQQQMAMAGKLRLYLDNYVSGARAANLAPAEVYAEVAAWKGSVSAQQQLLRARQRALAGDPNSEVGQFFAQFDAQTRRLAALTRYTPKPEEAANIQQAIHEVSESVDTLQQRLSRLDPDFHRAWAERKISPAELRQALPADAALVDLLEYSHYIPSTEKGKNATRERRVVAFVLRINGPIDCVQLGASAPIGSLVGAWRAGYGRLPASDGELPGVELRHLLWEPLAPHLAAVDTMLVSPDGTLAQLPWGALPGDKPGTFLIEDRAIAVIAIPQMLPELLGRDAHPGPPASLLLAGDINYGGDPGAAIDHAGTRAAAIGRMRNGHLLQFQKLDAAQAELASIERQYRKRIPGAVAATLDGSDATEAAFRGEAPKHPWLHLITHGFFAPPERREQAPQSKPEPINPGLLSGLVFAGANTPQAEGKDDGILTALEVSSLDLSHVDTVVLSACETGLGQVAGGEGLLGLQRSFQMAGAKTVVASLWKVPDAATGQLMQRFYENMWDRKLGKLAALREAQIYLIRNQGNPGLALNGGKRGLTLEQDQPTDAGALLPFYWAAFVLSGDWR